MRIFKTSGKTIESVLHNKMHAFDFQPAGWYVDEMILISKNKSDLEKNENQIQYIAYIKNFRIAKKGEVQKLWPGNEGRWKYVIEFKKIIKLSQPFDLKDLLGVNNKYRSIQTQGKIESQDEDKIKMYLKKINAL